MRPDNLKRFRKLEWMVAPDDGEWFYIPGTNRSIVGNEWGHLHHSLTWMEFRVGWDKGGAPIEICGRPSFGWIGNWNGWQDHGPVSNVVEVGEELYSLLVASGAPLWATDLPLLQQWLDGKAFTLTEHGHLIMESEAERINRWEHWEREWRKRHRPYRRRTRDQVEADEAAKADRRAERVRASEQYATMMRSPEYAAIFESVLGKSLAQVLETDSKYLINSAHVISRYRYGLEVMKVDGDEDITI